MSQRVFDNLLYTIRDVGFQTYEDGDRLPDGRVQAYDDPLKPLRKWVDQLQEHWHTVFTAGAILVVDESMIRWKGAINVHMT
jgi:hypothetical protein